MIASALSTAASQREEENERADLQVMVERKPNDVIFCKKKI